MFLLCFARLICVAIGRSIYWSYSYNTLIQSTTLTFTLQSYITLREHRTALSVFIGVRVTRSFVFSAMLRISLFILLSFFFWPLYCLSFELRLFITLLESLSFTCSFAPFFFWPLYCLSFCDLLLLTTPLISFLTGTGNWQYKYHLCSVIY